MKFAPKHLFPRNRSPDVPGCRTALLETSVASLFLLHGHFEHGLDPQGASASKLALGMLKGARGRGRRKGAQWPPVFS